MAKNIELDIDVENNQEKYNKDIWIKRRILAILVRSMRYMWLTRKKRKTRIMWKNGKREHFGNQKFQMKSSREFAFIVHLLCIYKRLITPTVIYACDTWVLNKVKEESLPLGVFGRKKTEESCTRRTNLEFFIVWVFPQLDFNNLLMNFLVCGYIDY